MLDDERLVRAGREFRLSGSRWAELAERALAVAGRAGRRLEARVFEQMTGIPAEPGEDFGVPPEPAGDQLFLDAAADLVDDARAAEARAAALMLS